MGKILLARHAKYRTDEKFNPNLSEEGLEQAKNLAMKIQIEFGCPSEDITIWTSPTNRTIQTAEIIKNELLIPENNFTVCEKLSTDFFQEADFIWLKRQVRDFQKNNKGNLIIITHQEYSEFPSAICLGFVSHLIGFAQGILMDGNKATFFN